MWEDSTKRLNTKSWSCLAKGIKLILLVFMNIESELRKWVLSLGKTWLDGIGAQMIVLMW